MKDKASTETPAYSVIIPAFNEAEYIEKSLASIVLAMAEVKSQKGEIVVVDNNSTDNTSELALANGARVVFEKKNHISLARNKGAESAKGKVLFFIDADTEIHSKLLSLALNKMLGDDLGGGGSLLVFDSDQNSYFLGRLIPRIWSWISEKFNLAAGSFIFCKKSYFDLVGGFSDKVFAGEEIIFSQKYKKLCKINGQKFEILREYPVITSSRKLIWFSPAQILISILIPLVFPLALRWRVFCGFWYKRPKGYK